jgi:methionine-rich copper-binding protein CopC
MLLRLPPLLLSLAAYAVTAAPAQAKPNLVAAVPTAQATVTAPRQITLTFSEAVAVPPSSVALVMTAMPGMAHHDPMKVTGFATSLSDGGKTLQAILPRALPAGTYRLTWQAGSSSGEMADGAYSFSVK